MVDLKSEAVLTGCGLGKSFAPGVGQRWSAREVGNIDSDQHCPLGAVQP